MNAYDEVYRRSNAKWGYQTILKLLNQQCVRISYELNCHQNAAENHEIDKAKAEIEGRKFYERPKTTNSGLEQGLAQLMVDLEQVVVLLQDRYPESKKDFDSYLKHWRSIVDMNGGVKNL